MINIVPSACSLSAPTGTLTVQGPTCLVAAPAKGKGSITDDGEIFYPAYAVLIGLPENPLPINTNVTFNFVYLEADTAGHSALFDGNGTINTALNGNDVNITAGSFFCDGSPVCSGMSGTITGYEVITTQ
jgi:hypothetical protein